MGGVWGRWWIIEKEKERLQWLAAAHFVWVALNQISKQDVYRAELGLGMSKTGTTDLWSAHPVKSWPCSVVVHYPQHMCVVCCLQSPCSISNKTKVVPWMSPGQGVEEAHQKYFLLPLISVYKQWLINGSVRDMWNPGAYQMSYSTLLWQKGTVAPDSFVIIFSMSWETLRREIECFGAQLYSKHSIIYRLMLCLASCP